MSKANPGKIRLPVDPEEKRERRIRELKQGEENLFGSLSNLASHCWNIDRLQGDKPLFLKVRFLSEVMKSIDSIQDLTLDEYQNLVLSLGSNLSLLQEKRRNQT